MKLRIELEIEQLTDDMPKYKSRSSEIVHAKLVAHNQIINALHRQGYKDTDIITIRKVNK